jgi:hypothetical protein
VILYDVGEKGRWWSAARARLNGHRHRMHIRREFMKIFSITSDTKANFRSLDLSHNDVFYLSPPISANFSPLEARAQCKLEALFI